MIQVSEGCYCGSEFEMRMEDYPDEDGGARQYIASQIEQWREHHRHTEDRGSLLSAVERYMESQRGDGP